MAVHRWLVLAGRCEGKEITTVEGLSEPGELNRLQKLFLKHDPLSMRLLHAGHVDVGACIAQTESASDARSFCVSTKHPDNGRENISIRAAESVIAFRHEEVTGFLSQCREPDNPPQKKPFSFTISLSISRVSLDTRVCLRSDPLLSDYRWHSRPNTARKVLAAETSLTIKNANSFTITPSGFPVSREHRNARAVRFISAPRKSFPRDFHFARTNHGIIPHSNILFAMGPATRLRNSDRT